MTQRASQSLVAVLIRIGLLLALAIMLMAENAQAATSAAHSPEQDRAAINSSSQKTT